MTTRLKRKNFLKTILLLALLTSGIPFAFAQGESASGGWPMFHGNAARTGFSDSKVPSKPNVLWQITTKTDAVRPVVENGQVFFAADYVFAANLQDGKILWKYKDESVPFYPNGLAAANNKVFATVNDTDNLQTMRVGLVYGLDAETGKFLWKTQIAADPSHSLPLVAEGKVFIGDDSGTLNALDAATGKILWQKKLVGDGEIHSSPAYADGLVFIGTEGDARYQENPRNPSSMLALKPATGEIVWQFPIDYAPDRVNLIHATPAVANGVVYFGSENGWFYALNATDGSLIWKKELATGREMVGTSAAAGLGYGKVFVSLWSGKFLALDQKSGETVWEFSYEGEGTDSSPVVADSKVCLGANEGYFYCLDAETGGVLWKEKLGGPSAALASGILIVPGPVLLAFADEGQAALKLPEAGLPETKSPKSKLPLLSIFAGSLILVTVAFKVFKGIIWPNLGCGRRWFRIRPSWVRGRKKKDCRRCL